MIIPPKVFWRVKEANIWTRIYSVTLRTLCESLLYMQGTLRGPGVEQWARQTRSLSSKSLCSRKEEIEGVDANQ